MHFLRQSAVVAGGIALGQLVQLIATPVLARVYTPGDFGIYATFMSLCTVFAITACFRYELAIPVVSDNALRSLMAVAGTCAVVSGVLVAIAVVASGLIGSSFHTDTVSHMTWALPLAAVSCGVMQLGVNDALRRGHFSRMAVVRIAQPLVFVAVGLTGAGLVPAHLLGLIGAAAIGIAGAGRAWIFPPLNELWATAKRYRQYPLLSLPTAALDALALAMPVLIIASTYGQGAAGNYSQVQRLIGAPLLLAGIAIGQVFFKHCGELARGDRSVAPLLLHTVTGLAIGGAILLALAFSFGTPVMLWLLGEDWRTDTFFILIVLAPILVRGIASPVSTIFIAVGRMRLGTIWQIVYFFANLVVLYTAANFLSFDQFLIVFAANETWLYLLYLFFAYRAAVEFQRGLPSRT